MLSMLLLYFYILSEGVSALEATRFDRSRKAAGSSFTVVLFYRRPISHTFDFHAHAREGVSLRVSPFLSNFIADARYNTYVRLGLSTVIGFSSGDRESREIETHGVKIETRTLRDTRRATCRKRLGNTWDRQKPGSWDLEFKQAWGNPSFLRPN